MNCNLKGGRGLSQLEGRVIIRTQNCNFNIDHLLLFPQIPTKACRHWAARCGLHKNPMLHLSYWELKPFHGFFPIRKLQFWVLTPPEQLERRPRRRKKKKGKLHRVVPHLADDERDLHPLLLGLALQETLQEEGGRRDRDPGRYGRRGGRVQESLCAAGAADAGCGAGAAEILGDLFHYGRVRERLTRPPDSPAATPTPKPRVARPA